MTTINSVGNGLTGSTGTGSFVGSTGATINDATFTGNTVLGTPLSGDLSNCSGVTYADRAGYLAFGAANQMVYQTGANTTGFLNTQANGVLITNASGVPSIGVTLPAVGANSVQVFNPYTSTTTALNTALQDVYEHGTVDAATNITGGSANQILYQSGPGVTDKLNASTGALVYTGSALAYTATPTLTGTNFSGIPNSATTATSANTNSAIVARDGSGNFSAGTITADLTGTASLAQSISSSDLGVIYQSDSNITSIIPNGSGYLHNDGSGAFTYNTPTDLVGITTYSPSNTYAIGDFIVGDGTNGLLNAIYSSDYEQTPGAFDILKWSLTTLVQSINTWNAVIGNGSPYQIDAGGFINFTGESAVENTFVGVGAGQSESITGGLNTAVGDFALYSGGTISGSNNIAIGSSSMGAGGLRGASYNIGVGTYSLASISTGTYNIAIGKDVGNAITTGDSNILIGGYSGTAALSNTFVLSNPQNANPIISLTGTDTAYAANTFLATPNGSTGGFSNRAIVAADLPSTITSNTTGTADNISGGAAGQVLYQSGAGTTAKLTASAGALCSDGATTIFYKAIASTPVANNLMQYDSSGDSTANIFHGSLDGNANSASTAESATTATNLAIGTVNQIPFQSGTGTTTFMTAGANKVLVTNGSNVPSLENEIVASNLPNYAYQSNWTPTDGSGAGLTFTGVTAKYNRAATQYLISLDLTYPTTVDASGASLNGLPANSVVDYIFSGLIVGGPALVAKTGAGTDNIALFNAVTGVLFTNAELSEKQIFLTGTYSS